MSTQANDGSEPGKAQKSALRNRLFSTPARHTPESTGSTTLQDHVVDENSPANNNEREGSTAGSSTKRRKVPAGASKGAQVVTSSSKPATSKPDKKPRTEKVTRSKPSLVSRVARRVIPCVAPSPMDVDDVPMSEASTRPSVPPSAPASAPAPAIPAAQPAPETPTKSHDSTATAPKLSTESHSHHTLPVPTNTLRPATPVGEDADVVVPPPPTAHLLPQEETDGLTSGAVQPPGSSIEQGQIAHQVDDDSEGSYTDYDHDQAMLDEQEEEERLIRSGGNGIPIGPDGKQQPLLPPVLPEHKNRKCLVLDLDETLVHSSFKAVTQSDFIVPVEIEYHVHQFHVLKRPGVDDFLKEMGKIYEVVIFTASLSKYADPVLDKLDIHKVVAHRLFRESCYSHKGNYVKDLSQLGRPIEDTIILDNSPASYIFHPNNAVPVSSWFNDPHDAELTDLVPFLADLTSVPDVRGVLNPAI